MGVNKISLKTNELLKNCPMTFLKICRLVRSRLAFILLMVSLFFLPILDGGTYIFAKILILTLPLPLFLIGSASGEIQFKKLPSWPVFFFFLFLSFVGISVVGSTSHLFSIPTFFQALATFLFFILFCLTATKEKFKLAVSFILFIGFILCLLSFYYLLPQVKKPTSMNLVYATHGHSHLADYLLLVIPIALALFLKAKQKKQKVLFGGLLVFYFLSFILTFSRGAFLILPGVMILMFLLLKPKTGTKKLISWLLVLVPFGISFLILIFSLSSFGISAKLAEPQHWLVRQLVKPEFHANRLYYWRQALEGFFKRPLFGFGWGTFEIVALRFQKATVGWSDYTHNFYLQILAEGGIFACFSFLGFLGLSLSLIWRQVRKHKENPFVLGGFGAVLASCFHSFLDYDWHFPAVFLTFLFLLANLAFLSLTPQSYKLSGLRKFKKIFLLIGLSTLVFIFGWMQLAGEYFYLKEDYEKAIAFSPWPPVRARKIGSEIFEKDFSLGKKIGQRLITFSSQDPSMHYWLADKYYSGDVLEKAAAHYQKAIIYNPLGNYHLYQKLSEIYGQLGEEEKMDELYKLFAQRLKKTKAFQNPSRRLAKALYSVGWDYLDQQKKDEVILWWEKAVEAAPEWSYFHVELASLYLDFDDSKETEAVLNYCLNFYYPKNHCQEYLEKLSRNRDFEPPGFWREKILAIPD